MTRWPRRLLADPAGDPCLHLIVFALLLHPACSALARLASWLGRAWAEYGGPAR
jgi:hypothetical protein